MRSPEGLLLSCYDPVPCPSKCSNAHTGLARRANSELFLLHKNRREARAVLMTHQLGWELRLMIGAQLEVVQTKVCRTQDDVFGISAGWRAVLIEKGWS